MVLNIDSIPLAYRAVAGVPNAALMNVMACRVYRNTRLGFYREDTMQTLDIITATSPPAFVESPYSVKRSSMSHLELADSLDEMDIGQFFKNEPHQVIGEGDYADLSTLI